MKPKAANKASPFLGETAEPMTHSAAAGGISALDRMGMHTVLRHRHRQEEEEEWEEKYSETMTHRSVFEMDRSSLDGGVLPEPASDSASTLDCMLHHRQREEHNSWEVGRRHRPLSTRRMLAFLYIK